jgi:hypothetical protein
VGRGYGSGHGRGAEEGAGGGLGRATGAGTGAGRVAVTGRDDEDQRTLEMLRGSEGPVCYVVDVAR